MPTSRVRVAASAVLIATLAVAAAGTSQLALTSGLDLSSIDRSVRPQDDLYRFANGRWLDRTEIPGDRVSYSAFTELADRLESDLRDLITGLDGRGDERKIRDLYASMLDEARIESLGATPIRDELTRIDAIDSPTALARELGRSSSLGDAVPFATSAGIDTQDPSAIVVTLTQGGTLLPDPRYYFEGGPYERSAREHYVEYLATIFTLAGRPNARADARAVLELETRLARAQEPVARARSGLDARAFTLRELAREVPGFHWKEWARPQGFDLVAKIVLEQPAFFRAFASAVAEVPIETWRAWLAARYITATSVYISSGFSNARFEFFGTFLTGQMAPRERWKRGVSMVNGFLGDALGRIYVRRYFPESSRARVGGLVHTMVAAYRAAVDEADWMTPQARRQAREKLDVLEARIGYPDQWRSYDGLRIDAGDLVGNLRRARQFENDYLLGRLRRNDPREWLMTPQTVNAYYTPSRNEIILPAAMLQPPLYDPGAEDAANYGGIGALIGHELSHALDEPGRRFDGHGRPVDGWTPKDEDQFRSRAAMLAQQFSGYSPFPGSRVNGELTVGENLGDLVGLAVTLRAYRLSLRGQPSPVIDGFTGEQRLFIKWAQIWRERVRGEYLRQTLLYSPYAPAQYRANGAASNLDGFYEAFGVRPGDQLYRAPGLRVRIW